MSPLRIRNEVREQEESPDSRMFLLWLIMCAEGDYIAMRATALLFGNVILARNIAHDGAECIEKIMKAFLVINNPDAQQNIENKYGHNLEVIRKTCSKIDSFFDDIDLKVFCKNYSNKGNVILRYGLPRDGQVEIHISKIISLVDKIFLGTILLVNATIDHFDGSVFFQGTINIAALLGLVSSPQLEAAYTPIQHVRNMRDALTNSNPLLKDFESAASKFWKPV